MVIAIDGYVIQYGKVSRWMVLIREERMIIFGYRI